MGWSAARKLRKAIDNLTKILAIELVTASRAIDLRAPLTPSPVSMKVITELRKTVAGPGPDRYLSPELVAATEFVAAGKVMNAIQ
jgi:histidine ammonia-lyase